MTATTGMPAAEPGLRRLVLDVDAWAQLVELANATAPADFAVRRPGQGLPATAKGSPGVAGGLGEDVVAEAGAQALQRLRAGGLVDGASRVHPGMAAALALLGGAPVRVRVRSWSGDRVVLGALALSPDGGVGLARLRRVSPGSPAATDVPAGPGHRERAGEPGPGVRDAVGVELSVFPAELALGCVRRLLPGLPAGPVPGSGASLPWADLLPLVEALQVARRGASRAAAGAVSDLTDGVTADLAAQVDAEVIRLLAQDCGADGLPSWMRDLSAGLDSVVEITVVAVAGTGPDHVDGQAPGPAVRTWLGMWVRSGEHLVSLGAHAASTADEPDPGGPTTSGPVPAGTEPAGGVPGAQNAVIDLVETDEAGLLREVGSGLAEALAWAMRSADAPEGDGQP